MRCLSWLQLVSTVGSIAFSVVRLRATRTWWTWFHWASNHRFRTSGDAAMAAVLRDRKQVTRAALRGTMHWWRPYADRGDWFAVTYNDVEHGVYRFPPYAPSRFGFVSEDVVLAVTDRGEDCTERMRVIAGPRGNFYMDEEARDAGVCPLHPAHVMQCGVTVTFSDGSETKFFFDPVKSPPRQ